MRFKDASKIHTAVESMRLANYPCAVNRAKVNELFNGNPPWSEAERQANKIFCNVNPLYGTRIAHNARQNLSNALLKPGNFFTVRLNAPSTMVPRHKRQQWGLSITQEINRILKKNRRCAKAYSDMWEQSNAQVVLHGIGPSWWFGKSNPIPKSIGIEDVLVPAQTQLDFSNLEFFAIYRQWTYSELYDMTYGAATDKGWNMPFVNQLLANLEQQDLQSTIMGNRWLMPEKLEEDLKENAGWYMTSAAPTIYVWDFYFRDHDRKDEDKQWWNRRVVLDYMQMQPEAMRSAVSDSAKTNFLYEQDRYAGDRSEIVHFQVGNCSNVAPFRYYSVRSLGFLLFAVCQLQSRIYNRFADSTFANLLELFRNVGEDDRERLEKVDLYHMGIVPDGLSFVTAAERHEVNEAQVQMFMALNKQLMGESSSTYMPEVDTGTDKERTLGEARMQLQTSVSLSNALLNQTYNSALFSFTETARRLCMDSNNPLAKEFKERLQMQGVPKEVLDVEMWDIEPERVLGGGNKAIEMLQADRLMAARGAYDPDAQRKILHIYTEANTDDPMLAEELVPLDDVPVSNSVTLATTAMGTLMEGLPVVQQRNMNHVDYTATLLQSAGQVIAQLEGMQQVPQAIPLRMQKIAGLSNVLEHAAEHLQVIATDPTAKDVVKALNEQLMELGAALKAQAEQLDEEMKSQDQGQGMNEEMRKLQARLAAIEIEAQARAQMKMADHEQKQAHRDAQWMNEERRRDAATAAELERKQAMTAADVQSRLAQTQATIIATDMTTAAEIQRPKPASGNNGKSK